MQPSRTATVCEVDRARKRAASRKRAQNLGYRDNQPLETCHPETTHLTATEAHVRLARRLLALAARTTRAVTYTWTCYTEGFSHFVTSMTAPVKLPAGAFAGWDLHPPESVRLLTAHAHSGQSALVGRMDQSIQRGHSVDDDASPSKD